MEVQVFKVRVVRCTVQAGINAFPLGLPNPNQKLLSSPVVRLSYVKQGRPESQN